MRMRRMASSVSHPSARTFGADSADRSAMDRSSLGAGRLAQSAMP